MTDLNSPEARSRRCELARDILLELDRGTMTPTQSVYARFRTTVSVVAIGALNTKSPLFAEVNGYPCAVCACGALAVAAVRKGYATGEEGVVGALSGFFPPYQLAVIERVFMGEDWDADSSLYPDFDVDAHTLELERWWGRFGLDYGAAREDLEGALRAVMLNIIEHGGDFNIAAVPPW